MTRRNHQLVRFFSLAIAASSVAYMGARANTFADVTEEGLSEITPETLGVIENIGVERPVTVHAFVSKEVPREYVTARTRLLNILRTMEAKGGPGLTVRIVEPEPYSLEAEEAMENFGIVPRPLADRSGGRVEALDVFMGLAFVSGPREEVVPFLDRGLSVEYEVARALRVVTQEKKRVVGILRTDATIMGNFDLQAKRQQPAWQIIAELKKQYEVRSLNPKAAIPEDVDVLLVPQLSSCTQDELDQVRAYVDAGRPALLTVDPMPLFDVRLSPREPKLPPPGQQNNMFGGPPPGEPKGDYVGLLRDFGVEFADDQIVYDRTNPNPVFSGIQPQIVFAHRTDGSGLEFEGVDPTVDGLSQVVFLYPGALSAAAGYQDKFTPLLETSKASGVNVFEDLVQRHPLFGISGPVPPRALGEATPEDYVLAARVQGGAKEGEGEEGSGGNADRNLIVLADLDMLSDLFFQMHARGGDVDGDGLDDVRFDNVSFLLNAVDSLAGDDRFLELRRRRQTFRRLTKLDEETQDARDKRQTQIDEANKAADAELEEAKTALEAAVAAVQERDDLDETTKQVLLKSAEETENRRLAAKTDKIEREKQRAIAKTETEHRRSVDEIQNRIRIWSLLLPPIPALLMGIFIFMRKRLRERDNIPAARRSGAASKGAKA
ncbi:MAG: Gldg family protein [Nannocystaceae bacterium]|nr:Gldg family protein [bacterium]